MHDLTKIPTAIEMRVVAYMARGDTYDTIRATIEKEFGRKLSAGVMTYIKKRNSESLATIREVIIQKEKDDAQGLLERSHRLIGKKLKAAEGDGDAFDALKPTDLVAISKEMFHQTKVEQGVGDDVAKLTNPKEKLKELQAMLEENDEIRLERIVFAKREQTAGENASPIQVSGVDGADDRGGVQGEDLSSGNSLDGEILQARPEV